MVEQFLVETAADLAYVNQPFSLVVESQHERAEVSARPFRFGVAADNAIDALTDLDLQPLVAAALLVETGLLFCHDPFQLSLLRDLKERLAMLLVVVREAQRIPRNDERRQLLLPLFQRHTPPVVAIEIEEIERVIEHRNVGVGGSPPAARTKPGPLLHQAEGSAAIFIERHDLAVENRVLCLDEARHVVQFWIAWRQFVLIPRHEPD